MRQHEFEICKSSEDEQLRALVSAPSARPSDRRALGTHYGFSSQRKIPKNKKCALN